jgi:hypothetical protein
MHSFSIGDVAHLPSLGWALEQESNYTSKKKKKGIKETEGELAGML